VPILGYLRWLLLSLFIKLDNTPKCGVAWFIIKERNKLFISWILWRLVLWLVVCILPIPIKRFYSFDLLLDWQSITNLLLVGTNPSSIYYYQPLWKLSSRPDTHLIACSKSLLLYVQYFSQWVLLSPFDQIVKRNALEWSMMFNLAPIFMRESVPLGFKIDGPIVSLGGMHPSNIH